VFRKWDEIKFNVPLSPAGFVLHQICARAQTHANQFSSVRWLTPSLVGGGVQRTGWPVSDISRARRDARRARVLQHHAVSILGGEAVAFDDDRGLRGAARLAALSWRRRVGRVAAFALARLRRIVARDLVFAPRVLDQPRAVLLALPPQRRRHRLVTDLARPRVDLAQFGSLLDWTALAREKVFGERVKNVYAEHEVALADRDVHRNDFVLVGLVDLQRRLEHVQEVGQLVVADVLGAVRIEVLPDFVVHVVVVISETFLHVFRGLRVVLQNHSDVHVDDDKEADDQISQQEGDADCAAAAVARVADLRVGQLAVLLVDDAVQHTVPAGGGGHLEKQDHRLPERLEVVDVVEAALVLYVHEEGHAEDGKDEHDQEEQQADVEQGWQRHSQREKQRPDAFGTLH